MRGTEVISLVHLRLNLRGHEPKLVNMRIAPGFCVLAILVCSTSFAQTPAERPLRSKTEIYVTHTDHDRSGMRFAAAVKRALLKSGRYQVREDGGYYKGFKQYVEMSSLEVSPTISAVSVVIEDMGMPNSYPVSEMWYHKLFLVEPNRIDEMAAIFVEDIDASWCRHNHNYVANCPKELIEP